MIVLLRCPNCGTTRSTPGECEACHDAQVRYFCTNHTPGLWLDTPACPKCGASFGAPLPRSSPSVLERPRRPRPAAVPLPSRAPPPPAPYVPPDAPAAPLWLTLLRNVILARRRPASDSPESMRAGRGAGGCLLRAALLILFLFLGLMAVLIMFGWSLLQGY